MLTRAAIVDRLFADNPRFHSLDEAGSRWLAAQGIDIPAGDLCLAVPRPALEWIAEHVTPEMDTIETGAGYTTVIFAALGKHHRCHTVSAEEARRVSAYLAGLGIPAERVEWAIGRSDETLSRLSGAALYGFAFIDGCHGYPYPAMDWHFIDLRLRVGGILGMDNAEIRPVAEHCRFLEENGSYERIAAVVDREWNYGAHFYRKLRDEPREWNLQPYSRVRHLIT